MIHVETPRPSKGVLLAADDAVAAVQDTLARHLRPGESGCEVVTEELIAWHLRSLRRLLARRAAVDSGQDGKAAAAVSRPVQPPAGLPPLPGGGFTLPRPPDFKIGVR